MELFSKYENAEVVTARETKTFRAREMASRHPVLLHQLSSQTDPIRQQHLLAVVLRYLSARASGGQNPIRAVEEHEGSLWVITEDRPELLDLWDWMGRQAGDGSAPTPAGIPAMGKPSPAVVENEANPDDRTSLLPQGAIGIIQDAPPEADRTAVYGTVQPPLKNIPAQPPEPQHAEINAHSPQKPRSAADSFETTRVLPVSPQATKTENNKPVVSQAPVPSATAAEDSTMILPSVPPPPLAANLTAAPDGLSGVESAQVKGEPPGEFTMLFQAPRTIDSPEKSEARTQPVRQPASAAPEPGESTMLFDAPSRPSTLTGSRLRFHGFTAPTQPSRQKPEAAPPPPIPPVASEPAKKTPEQLAAEAPEFQVFQQPGEFTRFFQSPVASGSSVETPNFSDLSNAGRVDPPQTGEFTKMFQPFEPATSGDASFGGITQQSPSPAPPKELGAFTRIFQIPVGSDLLTATDQTLAAVSRPTPEPVAPSPGQPGSFRPGAPAFQPPSNPVPPPAAETPTAQQGFRLEVKPQTPAAPKFPAVPIPEPVKVGAPPAAAQPPSPPRLPQVAIPKPTLPAKPQAPKIPGADKLKETPGPSVLPLILIFGGIVLVAVLVVLYFATRH